MLHRHPLLIAILFCVACASAAQQPATPLDSADLSHVPVVSADGKTTDLATLAAGRVIVASLWASWCEGCRQEEPALLRLHQLALARRDFIVVSIAIGTTVEDAAAAKTPYARLIDTGAFAEVGRKRVPATLVIDARGHTAFEGGALDRDALDALNRALAAH